MDILKKLDCRILSTVTQEDDETQWLKNRTRGIGGSDVGAICGVSNYSSPRTVYLKKTGQYDEAINGFSDAAVERMRFGNLLEPIVADEYARRSGKKIAVSPATLVHKKQDWALANIDRFILDENGDPYGILECKTAGEFMNEDWENGELPLYYIYQLNWYLYVCDLEFGAFACLVGGNKFYYYELYRNDDIIKEMVEKADEFWNHYVKNMIEPPLTGTTADEEHVKKTHTEVEKDSEVFFEEDEINDLAKVVSVGKAEIKKLEKIVNEASNRLKDRLKNKEIGYTKDYIVKWSPRTQRRIDNDKLKVEHPDVFEKCTKEISFRVFTVKGGK